LPETSRLNFQNKLNARLHDLEQQVNDMLLFSKSGKEQVVAKVSVNELIENTVSSMDVLVNQAGAVIKVQLPAEPIELLGNKNALSGALQNLIHNALQAGKTANIPQTIIAIQVYRLDNFVYLSLKDNGPGIDDTVSDKIFQPFYTSSAQGTGLGLAVVQSVVKAHQGEVNLISQSSEGAHFVLKLPLLEQATAGES